MRSLGAAGQFGQDVTNKQRVDAAGKAMFDPVTNQPLFDASNTTQSFMSPYQQNVTDFAKQSAVREAQMAQNAQNLMSPRQGTYAGARQTLSQMERERNLLSNLSNIQTQGSQSAYDKAMQTQQFGANLGMQGYGQAMGAGAQLGQLGGAEQAANIARQNQMATMGQQQQGLEQSKINQSIQDYATQQQYPLMQLGFMSNMLRGLPMQAATTQSYQAAPSPITQGLGLLAGAAGAKQAGLFKEGGTIKGLASGGVAGYANRGMVQSNPGSGVVQGIRQKLEVMPVQQLAQVAKTSSSEEVRTMALEILREKQLREQAEMQAQQSIMQDQRSMPTPVSENMGISAAPAGSMDTLSAASGGIVAFADEGQVELDPEEAARLKQDFLARQQYVDFARKQREAAGVNAPKAALAEFYGKQQADLGDERKRARGYDLMQFGVDLASQAGSLPYAAAKAGQRTLPGIISRQEGIKGRESDIAKGLAEVAEGERLMKAGDITAGNAMFEKGQERISRENIAGAKGPGNMMSYAQNYLAEKVAAGDKRDQNTILREGMDNYMSILGAAGPRAKTAADVATGNIGNKVVEAHAAIDRNAIIKRSMAKKSDLPKIEADIAAEKEKAERIIKGGGTYTVPSTTSGVGKSAVGGGKGKVNPAQFDADNS
jgi:hypothetical protein